MGKTTAKKKKKKKKEKKKRRARRCRARDPRDLPPPPTRVRCFNMLPRPRHSVLVADTCMPGCLHQRTLRRRGYSGPGGEMEGLRGASDLEVAYPRCPPGHGPRAGPRRRRRARGPRARSGSTRGAAPGGTVNRAERRITFGWVGESPWVECTWGWGWGVTVGVGVEVKTRDRAEHRIARTNQSHPQHSHSTATAQPQHSHSTATEGEPGGLHAAISIG